MTFRKGRPKRESKYESVAFNKENFKFVGLSEEAQDAIFDKFRKYGFPKPKRLGELELIKRIKTKNGRMPLKWRR